METITNVLNMAKTAISGDGEGPGENDSVATQNKSGSGSFPENAAGGDASVNKPAESAAGATTGAGDGPNLPEFDPKNAATSKGPSESVGNTGDPTSGVNPNQHQNKFEGAGRPMQEPSDAGNTADSDGGPVNKAHENIEKPNEDTRTGGDSGTASDKGSAGSSAPPAGAGPPGVGGNDGPKPETESHGEGTGEKWEKSTGLAADGGDFDATRPGAGREADRLLAEKGIDRSEKGLEGTDSATGGVNDAAARPSVKDRIKEKLHH